jgi:hypothetical protein
VRGRGPRPHIMQARPVSEAGIVTRGAAIPVRPGAGYQVQAWVSGAEIVGATSFQVLFFNAKGHRVTTTVVPGPTGSFDWTPIVGRVVAPDQTATARIELHLSGWGRAWFDDIVFADEAQPSTNLAPDPGIEQASDSPWALRRSNGRSALQFLVNDRVHSGKQAVLLSVGDVHTGNRGLVFSNGSDEGKTDLRLRRNQRLPAHPGASYTATMWFRVSDGEAELNLVFRNAQGEPLQVVRSIEIDGHVDWTLLQARAIAPEHAATVEVVATVEGDGLIWLSDIVLASS